MEIVHRCAVMPFFLLDGFIPFMPDYDLGIDFILYREKDDLLIKVQQKGRWYIDKKYQGRDIGMLFPDTINDRQLWYLVPHDDMITYAREHTNYLRTPSWEAGAYSTKKLNAKQREHFAPYRLGENSNNLIYERFRTATRSAVPPGQTTASSDPA